MGLFRRRKRAETNPQRTSKKYGGLITGIVVGGAIGSVTSLLFAPKKGSETRADISDKSRELFEGSKTKAEAFLDKYRQ